MTALATLEDIEARLGRPILDEEKARVNALLEDISALVSAYCRFTEKPDPVPGDVKAVVCSEVIRAMTLNPGVFSQTTGDVSVRYDTSGASGLSRYALGALRYWRRRIGSVRVITLPLEPRDAP